MKSQLYRYVGPDEIRQRVVGHADRTCICSYADLRAWVTKTEPNPRRRNYIPVTFIVDDANRLWIAERRSEHVACAAGGCVLAAGELVISENGKSIEVVEATNQSTGYCPQPNCWEVVANALDIARVPHPGAFTTAFQFRRCTGCASINLIKEGIFECVVCGAELSRNWNFD